MTKQNDKYYRIQVVTYDISNECCEVKFLDYGGTEKVLFSDMWQIRQDFLNLPFQVCYLYGSVIAGGLAINKNLSLESADIQAFLMERVPIV